MNVLSLFDGKYEVASDGSVWSNVGKLEQGIANEIRYLYKTGGWSYVKLGEKFGIKKTNVGYIINNKRWINE